MTQDTNIAKTYDPKEVEDKIYKLWEESGFFNPDNLTKTTEPFVISMPPPNVTGVLHLGHALENALMDTMIRYQRLKGKKALLIPGTDHAAVATQAKVEKDLVKSGKYKNPRQELGREKLVELIRDFAEKSKATMLGQIRKLGTSCDWSRLAYTLDEQRSKTVTEVFIKMYNDGLIYRGHRVINWSVKGQSTCSDDELVYQERPAKLYTFKYSPDFPIAIATTRPETKLGDTAIAVNPDDERYQEYIGKTFLVDFGAQAPLKIKIIADANIDPMFGTGAVGVTPAHSQTDYEMFERHNLDLVQVIGEDGKMTAAAGANYQGLTSEEARIKVIDYVKQKESFIKEEDIIQNVATSDRFGDIVEVLPKTQWFVKVNQKIPGRDKTLKDLMRNAVTIGHQGRSSIQQVVAIDPERFQKIYLNWIDNLRDWCISRQIWWGHRLPVWYKKNNNELETKVQATNPGEGWTQDEDTLDTWFSSGMWTFSILGGLEPTPDRKQFHPNQWMQMGHEIIFFWLARMILMSTYAIDEIPFQQVYVHGILRDKDGRKFSKSLGNGIDPLEMINKYGADALRFGLLLGVAPGNDSRFYEEKLEHTRNFANKVWNVARYILTSNKEIETPQSTPIVHNVTDHWILFELNNLIIQITKNLNHSEFSAAAEEIKTFIWNDLADWYLEINKITKNQETVLLFVLTNILKLLHPFMPFITEEIWSKIDNKQLLMVEKWPEPFLIDQAPEFESAAQTFNYLKNLITAIRNLRAENKIPQPSKLDCVLAITDQKLQTLAKEQSAIIIHLAKLNKLEIVEHHPKSSNSITTITSDTEIILITDNLSTQAPEKLSAEIAHTRNYIQQLESKLANTEFVSRAPESVVVKEQEKLTQQKEKLIKLMNNKKSED